MSKFPLYDTLLSKIPLKEPTKQQLKDMIITIEQMTVDKLELVYMLIYYSSLEQSETKSNQNMIPYNGKNIGGDIHFDTNLFSVKLKKILFLFTSMTPVV